MKTLTNSQNKNIFCTIITSNYFFYAKAIYDSLKKFEVVDHFAVLVVDDCEEFGRYEGIEVYSLIDVKKEMNSEYALIEKYEFDKASALRWSLKPLFLKYLLSKKRFKKALFIDPDLLFFESPEFLFEKLNFKDILITPHWRSKSPILDKTNFESLFTGGLFNAGFFGCNSESVDILDWWLEVCAFRMTKTDGFYVDQAYLNLMPIYFNERVEIVKHKGCNVSNWNMIECERTNSNNTVLINNEYPIIFIHFTNATINLVANGSDNKLLPFLNTYKELLLKHNPYFKFDYETQSPFKEQKNKFSIKRVLKKILG